MATTRWLTATQQRAWRAYLVGTARLMDRLDRDLRSVGLSLAEYEIMVRLSEATGHVLRMAELADSVHHSRSRLTHTIGRMEAAGLVERLSCADDRRGVQARLTDDGYALLVNVAPIHVGGVRDGLVDVVSAEDFAAVGRAFEAVEARGRSAATRGPNAPPAM